MSGSRYIQPRARIVMAVVWTLAFVYVTTAGAPVSVMTIVGIALCASWISAGYSLAAYRKGHAMIEKNEVSSGTGRDLS